MIKDAVEVLLPFIHQLKKLEAGKRIPAIRPLNREKVLMTGRKAWRFEK
jgi:hypothetical protein